VTSQLVFRGQPLSHPHVQVTVSDANGERTLQPPAEGHFDWGYMGVSVGNLANAISAELYPEEDRQFAASLIKRHFLTRMKRHEAWELHGSEIEGYIAEKRPFPALAAGAPA